MMKLVEVIRELVEIRKGAPETVTPLIDKAIEHIVSAIEECTRELVREIKEPVPSFPMPYQPTDKQYQLTASDGTPINLCKGENKPSEGAK